MSDFKQAPGTGDETRVLDRAYEDSGTATAENVGSVTNATPENVVSVLSETRFPFRKGENSPSGTVNWSRAGKNVKGQSRLPSKEEFEELAALLVEARKQGKSEENISKFLRSLGFEPGKKYWSGTEQEGHPKYAWYWCAGNTEVIDDFYKTRLGNSSKTTPHYAQYIKPIGA